MQTTIQRPLNPWSFRKTPVNRFGYVGKCNELLALLIQRSEVEEAGKVKVSHSEGIIYRGGALLVCGFYLDTIFIYQNKVYCKYEFGEGWSGQIPLDHCDIIGEIVKIAQDYRVQHTI